MISTALQAYIRQPITCIGGALVGWVCLFQTLFDFFCKNKKDRWNDRYIILSLIYKYIIYNEDERVKKIEKFSLQSQIRRGLFIS